MADLPKTPTEVTPLRCWKGSLVAGSIATGLYVATRSIIENFADKPLPTGNATSLNIAVAVRTFVIGIPTMATGIFGLVSIGLLLLGFQILLENKKVASKE